jgi:hypothetical protein
MEPSAAHSQSFNFQSWCRVGGRGSVVNMEVVLVEAFIAAVQPGNASMLKKFLNVKMSMIPPAYLGIHTDYVWHCSHDSKPRAMTRRFGLSTDLSRVHQVKQSRSLVRGVRGGLIRLNQVCSRWCWMSRLKIQDSRALWRVGSQAAVAIQVAQAAGSPHQAQPTQLIAQRCRRTVNDGAPHTG